MSAISRTGSEGAEMDDKEFRAEKLYQTTMRIAREMLENGLISGEEYQRINAVFLEKYKPVFGVLFSE